MRKYVVWTMGGFVCAEDIDHLIGEYCSHVDNAKRFVSINDALDYAYSCDIKNPVVLEIAYEQIERNSA